MKPEMSPKQINIYSDMSGSLQILKDVTRWMESTGRSIPGWGAADEFDATALAPHAAPEEFFVLSVDDKPAATAIIQAEQDMQDWSTVDGNEAAGAMYIHYVAVEREFAGRGLVSYLVRHAERLAQKRGLSKLRLDTDADEPKVRKVYEDLGFVEVGTVIDDEHRTVLYERSL